MISFVRFPFAPVLSSSDRERENPTPAFGEAVTIIFAQNLRTRLLLPIRWGEGRGEGRTSADRSGRSK
jgi:hypothetical protein